MEEFIQKGSIYRHESGMYRIRERKGRAYEVEYAERPSLWISTGEKDFGRAVKVVTAMLHSARKYSPKERVVLSDFADGYFTETGKGSFQERCEKFGKRYEPAYFKQMNGMYKNYIRPFFGKMDIKTIKPDLVEEWYIGLTSYSNPGKALKDETKLKILGAMNELMKGAVRKSVIDRNPCDDVQRVTLHKDASKEREIFTDEEIAQLFPLDREKLLEVWGNEMYALYFSIMLDTGFRPGELAGLERSSFRGNGGVYTAREVDANTRLIKNRIKTTGRGKGKKYGLLSHYTEELLEEYLETLDGDDLFICEDGKFIVPWIANAVLREASERAGVDIGDRTQYCLRHTFDTHMMNSLGEKVKESDVYDLMAHTGYRPEYDHRTPDQILFKLQKVRPAVDGIRKNARIV